MKSIWSLKAINKPVKIQEEPDEQWLEPPSAYQETPNPWLIPPNPCNEVSTQSINDFSSTSAIPADNISSNEDKIQLYRYLKSKILIKKEEDKPKKHTFQDVIDGKLDLWPKISGTKSVRFTADDSIEHVVTFSTEKIENVPLNEEK